MSKHREIAKKWLPHLTAADLIGELQKRGHPGYDVQVREEESLRDPMLIGPDVARDETKK